METATRPEFQRGDRVIVDEPGFDPWPGVVLSVKQFLGRWHVEVRRKDELVWVVPARYVSLTPGEAP